MFETIAVNADHVVAIRASGRLSDEDYAQFLPVLEELIRREGPVSLYVDMEDFEGWEAKAAWDDLRFGIAHDVDFKRIAVVCDKKWIKWIIKLSAVFFTAEMRVFSVTEKQEAMDWIMGEEIQAANSNPESEEQVLPYKHILLATDFSAHARRAGQRARELADKYQARLSLVHVFDDFVLYDEFYEPVAEERFALQQTLHDAARLHLETMADEIGIKDPADVQLLVGAPRETILAHAEENGVDLIIVGSHGRRGLARLLGSVASGIVNSSPCDVLTVRL